METNFNEYVNAIEHADEIHASRVGGLGGSDADILLRVGRSGLSALTNTDLKRLAVMTAQIEPDVWGGNIYTNAGHAFEDYVASNVIGDDVKREVKLQQDLARNFKTFAHADFFHPVTGAVLECKFVGETETAAVIRKYYAQLQYYFLMGAKDVKIIHGTGDVEPFAVGNINVERVERDDETIDAIRNGIALIDEFVETFVFADSYAGREDVDDAAQVAIDELLKAKNDVDAATERYNAAKAIVESYMINNKLSKIETAFSTINLSKPTTTRSFDSKKFLDKNPEYNADEWFKVSEKKAYISIKDKK